LHLHINLRMKLNIEKTFPSSKNYKYYSNYIKYRMTICDLAVKEKLRELLLSSEDSIPIDEAIKMANKKWKK